MVRRGRRKEGYYKIIPKEDEQGNMLLKKTIDLADEESWKEAIIAEKRLLCEALTRAKKITYVTGYGKMSEFVTA